MTSMIYTKNTSGAIRRLRNKKPTKSYLSALVYHIKFTIAPAYNKGGYQVISKENIKNIGK
jgi:hypothetical protein